MGLLLFLCIVGLVYWVEKKYGKQQMKFMDKVHDRAAPYADRIRESSKRAWVNVISGIGIALLFIGIIANVVGDGFGDSNEIKAGEVNPYSNSDFVVREYEAAPKKWTEVYHFRGNGSKKSGSFFLNGNEARIRYVYRSGMDDIGVGMFSVYVVEQGKDIMRQGGFPEILSNAVNDEGESYIHYNRGTYYLHTNTMGSWDIVIEELK